MAETRSPRYPNVSLGDAISKAKSIYEKEHMSPLTPQVAAEAMGYSGLNGASLKMISSLKKYGLLDGRGDDVRLTKDAQVLIIDSPDGPEYKDAVRHCALNPEVFSEIRRQFNEGGSERSIAVFLEKQGFKPDAAALVAKNYKESMALISSNQSAYTENEVEQTVSVPTTPIKSQSPSIGVPTSIGIATGGVGLSGGIMHMEIGAPPRVVQQGNRLEISAVVDLKGLRKLKVLLDNYEKVLEMFEEQSSDLEESEKQRLRLQNALR